MTDMPEHVAGMTVNRWCGSSMQAIHDATGAIAINSGDVFLCCGVESMTFIPMNGLTYDPHPQLSKDNPNVCTCQWASQLKMLQKNLIFLGKNNKNLLLAVITKLI